MFQLVSFNSAVRRRIVFPLKWGWNSLIFSMDRWSLEMPPAAPDLRIASIARFCFLERPGLES
jgi:hypothetical protein